MPYTCKRLIATEGDSTTQEKRLSICLGANGFSFSITTAQGMLHTFGEVEGEHAASITDATRDIKAVFAEVGIRPLGFKNIELIVLSNDNVWVPNELYSSTANRQYLRLAGAKATAVLSCTSQQLGATMVFSANDQLVMAFKVALPGVMVINQHVRIATLTQRSVDHPIMAANWRKGRVDIASMCDGKYLYGNTLPFENLDEAVFQVVEVMKASGLDKPNAELLLCGDVDRELFARLRPYFPVTTLYSGNIKSFGNPELGKLHTYRHALILM